MRKMQFLLATMLVAALFSAGGFNTSVSAQTDPSTPNIATLADSDGEIIQLSPISSSTCAVKVSAGTWTITGSDVPIRGMMLEDGGLEFISGTSWQSNSGGAFISSDLEVYVPEDAFVAVRVQTTPNIATLADSDGEIIQLSPISSSTCAVKVSAGTWTITGSDVSIRGMMLEDGGLEFISGTSWQSNSGGAFISSDLEVYVPEDAFVAVRLQSETARNCHLRSGPAGDIIATVNVSDIQAWGDPVERELRGVEYYWYNASANGYGGYVAHICVNLPGPSPVDPDTTAVDTSPVNEDPVVDPAPVSVFCNNEAAFVFSAKNLSGLENCPSSGIYVLIDPWTPGGATSAPFRLEFATAGSVQSWINNSDYEAGSVWFERR